jgi:hypothetical protein
VVPVAEERLTVLPQIEFRVLELRGKVTLVVMVVRLAVVAAVAAQGELEQTERAILLVGTAGLAVRLI